MSDSAWPHRWQPTRLPRPWDSAGKNTGVSCHFLLQCMKVKSESKAAQSCPTLSDSMDCSLTGSSIHGIFQARVLEWGAIVHMCLHTYECEYSVWFQKNIYSWLCMCVCVLIYYTCAQSLSLVWLLVTPWSVAHQAPLSLEFSRQECWSGLSFPSPGDLSDPAMEPTSLVSPELAGGFFTIAPHRKLQS